MSDKTSDTPQLLGEISHGPSAFEQFLERNQKGLIVLAIVGALAGCGVIIYRGVEAGKRGDAGHELVKAEDLASLQTIRQSFPGTPAAGSASLLAADKLWSEGQQDQAISLLKEFTSSSPNHPAWASAQASLGYKLFSLGKNDEADAAFQEILNKPAGRFLAPYALVQLGDMAKLAGNTDRAKELYEKATKDYSNNNFATNLAQGRLTNLSAKAPTPIDPPPPADNKEDVKPANLLDLPGQLQPAPALPLDPGTPPPSSDQ